MKKLLTITFLLGSLITFSQNLSLNSGETYAVVVGISDYQDEAIPDLRFADKDAEAFAAFLQSPAGGALDEGHLKVLLNEQATAAQFAIALDWLWEVVKENDKVIIYFSGHGDVERKSLTKPGYLLCWDAPSRVYLAGGALALPMAAFHALIGHAYTHLPRQLENAKQELDKAQEMSPSYADTYIYLAQWSLKKDQPVQAWQYLEQGLEKGIGKWQFKVSHLLEDPDFEEMRKDPKWDELMKKYFPDQFKE